MKIRSLSPKELLEPMNYSETQEDREYERDSLIELIRVKYGSIRRFVEVSDSLIYANFRNMLLRKPISDWQLERIRWAKKIAMRTPDKKLNNEMSASEVRKINNELLYRGLSQNYVSQCIGVPRTTLRDLLTGKTKKKNLVYFKLINFLNDD